MKTQLIFSDPPIIVSDEKIKENDWFYTECLDNIFQATNFPLSATDAKKIIAGLPDLPSIDFSLLSEEECKTIGYVDAEKIFPTNKKGSMWMPNAHEVTNQYRQEGFKKAQSLEKKYSLEDMRNFCEYYTKGITNSIWDSMEEYIQSLQQTSWDVEVEMEEGEDYLAGMAGSNEIWAAHPDEPKITNNSIKVLKIL